MSISQETISNIRDRTILHELVGETVQLKRSGRNFVGLCPFHAEKSPSFSVNSEEGFYHCFGCSKHGSAFDFVMETRGLTFVEAVKFLGGRVGIEVQQENSEKSAERKKEEEQRKVLRAVVKEVSSYYFSKLQNNDLGGSARDYLLSRGVQPESQRLFQLGFASDSSPGALLDILKIRLEMEESQLKNLLFKAGIVGSREDGSQYETFKGRLIFPIQRSDGLPIALGGRLLENTPDRPKYINSKESPIYLKRQTLYGLSHALPYLRKEREALMVEGYMDVIALAQSGFPCGVATCGTSITPQHVELLRRFCDRIIVVMDSDPAGQKAAANCFELFLNSGLEVFGVSLPEGEDPGSYLMGKRVLEAGANEVQREFEDLLRNSRRPILETFLNYHLALTDRGPAALGKLSQQFMALTARIKNAVEREASVKVGAEILGVSVDSLRGVRAAKPKFSPPVKQNTASRPIDNPYSRKKLTQYLEQMLISIICEPSLCVSLLEMKDSLRELSTAEFPSESLEQVLREIADGEFLALENFKGRSQGTEFEEYLIKLTSVLNRHRLDGRALLAKAWYQIETGGGAPGKLVGDMGRISQELSIHSKVEKIRLEERDRDEDTDLGELVQRKLLQKRSLRGLQS